MHFDLNKHTILRVVHGSHAYGTNLPTSDVDYKGVAVSPLVVYLGVSKIFEQSEKYENKGADCDEVIYDIRKYCKLAMDGNPTILETLFVPEDCIKEITKEGEYLIENKLHFVSKKVEYTHRGFAYSQMRRLKSHRQWIVSPPSHKPERKEFGLSDGPKIKNDDLGAVDWLEQHGESISGNLMDLVKKEKAYKNALDQWNSFENWKKTRNRERYELESKYKYDLKHGMHVIRLYLNCIELLKTGNLTVRRPEKELLLDIRHGKISFDELIEMGEKLEIECIKAAKNSHLPKTADFNKIDEICQKIIQDFHERVKAQPR